MNTSKKKLNTNTSRKTKISKEANSKRKDSSSHSASKPSEVEDLPWLYAERKKGKYPKATDNSGKWLIYVWKHNLDLVWEKIRSATEKGLLGFASKVPTALPSPLAPKENLGVICVYTYDFTDKEDVMNIREELRKMGITNKIPYKSDNATLSGQYSFTKKGRVSIYYE